MLGLDELRRLAVDLRHRVDQLVRVELVAARVALVTPRAGRAADGAGALDVAVGQGASGRRRHRAVRRTFLEVAVGVDAEEQLLHHGGVVAGGGPRVEVVGDPEGAEVLGDQAVVGVGELLGGDSRLVGGDEDRRAVLVGAGDHQHVVARHPHVAAEDVGGHPEPGHVTDVSRAVGVGPGHGGEHLAGGGGDGHGRILCSHAGGSVVVQMTAARCMDWGRRGNSVVMSPSNDGTRVIAGRYSFDAQIGRGGMGVVWRGEDRMLGREVALKKVGMMPGGSEPDLVRAEREARLAARLNHPHIVAIFDLVAEGDAHWLVMEYVQGRTLGQRVSEEGPLDPEGARVVLAQAADALAAAHNAGILHRDVKAVEHPHPPRRQREADRLRHRPRHRRRHPDPDRPGHRLAAAYLAPEVASAVARRRPATCGRSAPRSTTRSRDTRPTTWAATSWRGCTRSCTAPEPRSDRAGILTGLLRAHAGEGPGQPMDAWTRSRDALGDPRRLDEATGRPRRTGPGQSTRPASAAAPVSSLVSRATERHAPRGPRRGLPGRSGVDDGGHRHGPSADGIRATGHRAAAERARPVLAPAPRPRRRGAPRGLGPRRPRSASG